MSKRQIYFSLFLFAMTVTTWWPLATAQISCIALLKQDVPVNIHVQSSKRSLPLKRYIYEMDGTNPEAIAVLSYYQKFQSDIFEQRLHKFQSSLLTEKTAIRDQDFLTHSRSTYVFILKSKLTPNTPPEFVGGIRAVFARNPSESLPYENDLGLKRMENKRGLASVEIGRLTNLEPNDLLYGANSTTALLIDRILRHVLQDPNVEWVYVHTSAPHVRLYRLLGYVPENISVVDNLNQVLQFSAENLKKRLNF